MIIKTKLEYLEALQLLEENGMLSKAISEGKIDGSTEECFKRQMEILDAMFEFEERNKLEFED